MAACNPMGPVLTALVVLAMSSSLHGQLSEVHYESTFHFGRVLLVIHMSYRVGPGHGRRAPR